MTLRIGSKAPDFTAKTTEGVIHFHEWIGDGWAILVSHPKHVTSVGTTGLGDEASLKEQFERRNCKVLGLCADRVKRKVAKAYGLLPPDTNVYGEMGLVLDTEASLGRRDIDDAIVQSVFVIGPDKRIKAMLTYPMGPGRKLDEVLRILDSCQVTAKAPAPYLRFAPQRQ